MELLRDPMGDRGKGGKDMKDLVDQVVTIEQLVSNLATENTAANREKLTLGKQLKVT